MRIAIPVWNDRVSPVFDVAKAIRVVDLSDGAAVSSTDHTIENERRAEAVVKLGIDVLICAAISIPLEATLWISGVEVIPDTCGVVEEIIEAFSQGDRTLQRFCSPGNGRQSGFAYEVSPNNWPRNRTVR